MTVTYTTTCGINSAVECQLPKLKVAGSNPVSRSKIREKLIYLRNPTFDPTRMREEGTPRIAARFSSIPTVE